MRSIALQLEFTRFQETGQRHESDTAKVFGREESSNELRVDSLALVAALRLDVLAEGIPNHNRFAVAFIHHVLGGRGLLAQPQLLLSLVDAVARSSNQLFLSLVRGYLAQKVLF
jgi:hypothetical protein